MSHGNFTLEGQDKERILSEVCGCGFGLTEYITHWPKKHKWFSNNYKSLNWKEKNQYKMLKGLWTPIFCIQQAGWKWLKCKHDVLLVEKNASESKAKIPEWSQDPWRTVPRNRNECQSRKSQAWSWPDFGTAMEQLILLCASCFTHYWRGLSTAGIPFAPSIH